MDDRQFHDPRRPVDWDAADEAPRMAVRGTSQVPDHENPDPERSGCEAAGERVRLRYTGHPIVDIGVATIAAFRGKADPAELTEDDLEETAQFLEREYFSGKLLSYLACVFPNAMYVQPGAQPGAKTPVRPEKIKAFKRDVLFGFRGPRDPAAARHQCAFCGAGAARLVYRQHVPMITGEDVLNFFPAGAGGLAICAPCLLAVQAFPLGARRAHGRALAVHSPDDSGLTWAFADRFLRDNRKLLLLAEQSGEKYRDAKAPRTLVVHVLTEVEQERRDRGDEASEPSVTVYHLTNFGEKPHIDVHHLPSQVLRFLRLVNRAGTAHSWHRVQAGAWERKPGTPDEAPPARESAKRRRAPAKRGAARDPAVVSGPEVSRNFLYEDLFDLPENAGQFVRTYLLRRAYRFAREGDPRREYSLSRERDLVSWDVTALFLREAMGMDRSRVDAIRMLGDRIADHIAADSDRRLFQGLYRAFQYRVLRNVLIKASSARLRRGQPPLIGFDEFLLVFEEGEESARADWALARDLVLIRVIEQLHRQDWFGRQPEALPDLETEEESENEEPARR